MALDLFELSKEAREKMRIYYFEPRVIKKGKDECWEWIGNTRTQGYALLTKRFGKEKYTFRSHRLAWMFHHNSPIPPTLNCCHSCDNKGCVNPHHIFLATQKINIQDAKLKGRLFRRKYVKPK
jgi:hypothetical protein